MNGLRRLATRTVPDGFPRFGYVLECNGAFVGVLLMIVSGGFGEAASPIRVNVSSWYVRPEFRVYASLLSLRATSHRPSMFLNITPGRETLPILQAQGFKRFCDGLFIAFPALDFRKCRARVSSRPDQWRANGSIPKKDLTLLLDHYEFGCICVWCETTEFGVPVIFGRRRILPANIPSVQLIYCDDIENINKYLGIVSRLLFLRGFPIVMIAANGPLEGIRGKYYDDWSRMYFKGPQEPRIGDLSYTEAAIFGF